MARRVRIHADFRRDLSAQATWLRRNAEPSWLDRLDADLDRIAELVAMYPAAGPMTGRSGSVVLRQIVFPTTPYLAWYVYDSRSARGDAWLVRLFHAHQLRPAPDLSRWLAAVEAR